MTRIAVAAPNRHAVDAAARACAAGGNAVDSALAAMATAVATEPGMVTPLGGAFVSVWPAGGEPVVVDGNVEMPGRGRPAEAFGGGLRPLRIDYGGGVELFVGHGSVATPGSFAAFQEAHDRFGGLPWAEVLAPAIDVLRSGFVVGQASETYLCFVGGPIFGWDAETRRSHHRADGAPLRRGDVVRLPDLAASYEVIAREGAAALYTGSLARAIVADMDARGGLLSAEDLAAYRPVVREPYRVTLGDWHVATNPPPTLADPPRRPRSPLTTPRRRPPHRPTIRRPPVTRPARPMPGRPTRNRWSGRRSAIRPRSPRPSWPRPATATTSCASSPATR